MRLNTFGYGGGRVILWGFLLSSPLAAAEKVVKSVDAQGHVTYSDHPPATAAPSTEVETLPGPLGRPPAAGGDHPDFRPPSPVPPRGGAPAVGPLKGLRRP